MVPCLPQLLNPVRHVWHNSFWKSVLILACGTGLAQAIPVAVSPLLTRLYSPNQFGILAAFTAALAVITAVAGLRFELAAVLSVTSAQALNLLVLSFLGVTAAAIGVALAGTQQPFPDMFFPGMLRPYAPVLAIAVWLTGGFICVEHWAVRQKSFASIASARLKQGCASALCQVVTANLSPAGIGLLIGHAMGQASGVLSLAKNTGLLNRSALSHVSAASLARSARQYWQFPVCVAPSTAINALGLHVPTLLLYNDYGPDVAGWYALGQRLIGLPVFLLGRAVSQAYLGEAASASSNLCLYRIFVSTAVRLAALGSVLITGIAVLSPLLVKPIFGSKWAEAGLYVTLMSPAFFAQFVHYPLSQTLNILGKYRRALLLDCVRLMLTSSVVSVAHGFGASPRQAVVGLSAALSLTYAMYFGAHLSALQRQSRHLPLA